MIKKPITIHLSTGLEARPVAQLVQVASQFNSEIYVEVGKKKVNAKSIMGMMTLGLDVEGDCWETELFEEKGVVIYEGNHCWRRSRRSGNCSPP